MPIAGPTTTTRFCELGGPRRKLPLEDLLSDSRREALSSDVDSMARAAYARREDMRATLTELGKGRHHRPPHRPPLAAEPARVGTLRDDDVQAAPPPPPQGDVR